MSMKAEKPLRRSPRGEKAVMPQHCPSLVHQIRRRADLEPLQNLILAAPAMAAGRVGADREVGDQADPGAGGASGLPVRR